MLDAIQIQEYLPHRYPFIMVDRVLAYEAGKTIEGLKNVTVNEPFFTGHFPGNPIMPGVLIVEALAQIAGILASLTRGIKPVEEGYIYYLAGTDNTRFKRPVVPGDVLKLYGEVTHARRDTSKFLCNAYVGDVLTCTTELLVAARKL